MPTERPILPNRFQFEDVPDLSGRVALVTGGSTGIGYEAALALAIANARVIIASSTEPRGLEAVSKIQAAIADRNAKGSVEYEEVDLGELSQVRQLAKTIESKTDRLDILLLDAGVGVAPFGLTKDGLGNHFAVNNLSQFVLVDALLPLLEKTASRSDVPPNSVRIVSMSSELHRTARSDVQFASLEEVSKEEDPNRLYARSKLGVILFIKQLVKRRLAPNGNKVLAIATHPGGVATDQQDGLVEGYGMLGKLIKNVVKPFMKSPEYGCESMIWAATAKEIVPQGYTGEYFTEPMGKPGTETDQAKSEQLENAFWTLCEKAASEH